MSAFRRDFDETKYMSILIKNNELLEKLMESGTKSVTVLKKRFDSEPVCNEKYIKTKIKTNFHGDKLPKKGSQYICLLAILIDSVFRTGKNYYPQLFLEECKYDVKEKKMSKYIIEDLEYSSDESDKEDSKKKNSNEENSDEEISKE